MASKKKTQPAPKDPNAKDPEAKRRNRQPIDVVAATADRTPPPLQRGAIADIPVVVTTSEPATDRQIAAAVNKRRKAGAGRPPSSGKSGAAAPKQDDSTTRLINASKALAESVDEEAQQVTPEEAQEVREGAQESKALRKETLKIKGPTAQDVINAAARQSTGIEYGAGDEDLSAPSGSVGGLTVGATGEVSGGYIETRKGGNPSTLIDVDEGDTPDPYGATISKSEEADYASSMRGPQAGRSAAETAREAAVHAELMRTRRQNRIAGARYTETRRRGGFDAGASADVNKLLSTITQGTPTNEDIFGKQLRTPLAPFGPVPPSRSTAPTGSDIKPTDAMRVLQERTGISDVPLESTTVEGLQRRQHFYMGEDTDTDPRKWQIVTGDPAKKLGVVEDPSKPYGVRPELGPAPTPLSRESIDRTYVGTARDTVDDLLRAKNMAEAVSYLDVTRAGQERMFDPSSAGKESASLEVGELPSGETGLLKVTKRRTGAMRRPSRRQALAGLEKTNPERYKALVESLSAGNIPGSVGARSAISKILDIKDASSAMSPQFLEAIGQAANIHNKNLDLSQSAAGRRELIERGARIVSTEQTKTGGLPIRYGGLPTVEGDELADLLSPEDYKAEVERTVKSPDVGFAVTPLRQSSRGERTSVQGPRPVSGDDRNVLPTADSAALMGSNAQERLNAVLRSVEEKQGTAAVAAARSEILRGSEPRIGIPPATRGSEMDDTDLVNSLRKQATERGETPPSGETLRDVVNTNWADVASNRRRLSLAAGVGGVNSIRIGRSTSGKASLITGGEDALQKFISGQLMQPPGGKLPAGDALRAPDVSTVGLDPNLTFTTKRRLSGIITPRASTMRDYRRRQEAFATQQRGKNTPVGPVAPMRKAIDTFIEERAAGKYDPVTIQPGGTTAAPIPKANPLAGMPAEALESRRAAAFETATPRPAAPAGPRDTGQTLNVPFTPTPRVSPEEMAKRQRSMRMLRNTPIRPGKPSEVAQPLIIKPTDISETGYAGVARRGVETAINREVSVPAYGRDASGNQRFEMRKTEDYEKGALTSLATPAKVRSINRSVEADLIESRRTFGKPETRTAPRGGGFFQRVANRGQFNQE